MTVLVDEVCTYPRARIPVYAYRYGTQWARLTTDENDTWALHAFAGKLGLHAEWFQRVHGQGFYWITPAKREQALRLGAVSMLAAEQAKRRLTPRYAQATLLPGGEASAEHVTVS